MVASTMYTEDFSGVIGELKSLSFIQCIGDKTWLSCHHTY